MSRPCCTANELRAENRTIELTVLQFRPHSWCLLTSAFSHEGTGHLAFNMITLFFMAPPVLAMLGNVGFLSLYLFSVCSSFALLPKLRRISRSLILCTTGLVRINFFSPLQPLRDAKPLLRSSCTFSNPPTLSSFKDLTANSAVPFQGASGATYGTIAFFAAAMPRATFLLFFVVPVPAWVSNHNLFRHSSGSMT